MFVGHYSAAFVAKAVEPRVPIWAFLLAAQWVDVFWGVFVLTGIEAARLDPTLASNPLDLHHMPYTHSLLGTLAWAGLAAGLARLVWPRVGSGRAAGIVAAVVASHWCLDWLVHRPDLTLFGAPPKLGLGLWDAPGVALALELGVLLGGAAFFGARARLTVVGWRRLAIAIAVLIGLQLGPLVGVSPPSIETLAATMPLIFLGVAALGARAEPWVMRDARA